MFIQTWLLPFMLLLVATVVAFPLSKYMAWIMDGKYRPWRFFGWFERRLDSGHQSWKQYTASLLVFNIVLFVFGYAILALQQWMPLNPRGLGMLAPTTIFHSVVSFMTNTDLQHYSGDQHLSNFSQIFWAIGAVPHVHEEQHHQHRLGGGNGQRDDGIPSPGPHTTPTP